MILAIPLALLILLSTSNSHTHHNGIIDIDQGNSAEQVRKSIGEPDAIKAKNGVEYWQYGSGDNECFLLIKNNEVMQKPRCVRDQSEANETSKIEEDQQKAREKVLTDAASDQR